MAKRSDVEETSEQPAARGRRSLERRSVADLVSDELRQMILTGEFEPDERVTQDQLASMLGVSTMPVREAVLRLTHEGLMIVHPGKSLQVTPPSSEDIRDIYWLHGVLAAELTGRAAKIGGKELATRLRAILEDEAGLGDPVAINREFHRAINKAADSPKLVLSYRNTLRFIPEEFFHNLVDWPELSQAEHLVLVDRIAAGDAEGAAELALRHAAESGKILIENLERRGHWTRKGVSESA